MAVPPRPRKLHITCFPARGKTRSFRCSSSPHKNLLRSFRGDLFTNFRASVIITFEKGQVLTERKKFFIKIPAAPKWADRRDFLHFVDDLKNSRLLIFVQPGPALQKGFLGGCEGDGLIVLGKELGH